MADATKEELDKSVQDAIDKLFASPNWRARVTDTVRDSFKSRENSRALKEKVTALEAQLKDAGPKDGAVVLSKEDAAVWAAFQKLGKPPADLTTILTEHTTLKTAETHRQEEANFADAAEALGYQNIPALTRMLTREGLVLEFKDVRSKGDDDKTVVTRTPFVRPKTDDKAALEPLDEYLEREVPEFIPIFSAAPVTEEEEEVTTAPRRGVPVSGVAIAATRGARETPPVTRDKKKLEVEEESQRASGTYAM